jgi:hypothetical protein
MKKMGKSLMKQGRQLTELLHQTPAVKAKPNTPSETAFDKAQKDLDTSLRAVHDALSQKDMTKAERHAAHAQKHFDVLFKKHRKAGKG